MSRPHLFPALLAALLSLGPALAEEGPTAHSGPGFWRRLAASPTKQDVFLALSSLEWGVPDRLSFTARYVHMLDTDRDHKLHMNNFVASLSPGLDGGRAGLGWQGITKVPAWGGVTFLSEARTVLLRTWSQPLVADPHTTYAGLELRLSVTGVVIVGGGYYHRLSTATSGTDHFWGLHVGVGM